MDTKTKLLRVLAIIIFAGCLYSIHAPRNHGPFICFHRSNLLNVALYGAQHAQCLETDLTITEGKLTLYHPPRPPTDFMLQDIVKIVNDNDLAIWIDSKNIDNPQNCKILNDYLETMPVSPAKVLIEYPPSTDPLNPEIMQCVKSINSKGYHAAFYMSIAGSNNCAGDLKKNPDDIDSDHCKWLRRVLSKIHESGVFRHITFPYYSLNAYERLEEAKDFTWNIWDVPKDKVKSIDPSRFYMIILQRNMAAPPGE